jgi:hypothetical protein
VFLSEITNMEFEPDLARCRFSPYFSAFPKNQLVLEYRYVYTRVKDFLGETAHPKSIHCVFFFPDKNELQVLKFLKTRFARKTRVWGTCKY